MKKLFWTFIVCFLISCTNEPSEDAWFRVLIIDLNVNKIVSLNHNYKEGDRVKITTSGETHIVQVLEKIGNQSDIVYTDKIQYLTIDSIKKGDIIIINNTKDTTIITKYKGELQNRYILK